MVIILVALTILVAFSARALFRYWVRAREVSRIELGREYGTLSPAVAVLVPGRVPQFPQDLYYHNGHAWMKFEEGHRITVGLDDFTQQVMGKFDKASFRPSKSSRGSAIAVLTSLLSMTLSAISTTPVVSCFS